MAFSFALLEIKKYNWVKEPLTEDRLLFTQHRHGLSSEGLEGDVDSFYDFLSRETWTLPVPRGHFPPIWGCPQPIFVSLRWPYTPRAPSQKYPIRKSLFLFFVFLFFLLGRKLPISPLSPAEWAAQKTATMDENSIAKSTPRLICGGKCSWPFDLSDSRRKQIGEPFIFPF